MLIYWNKLVLSSKKLIKYVFVLLKIPKIVLTKYNQSISRKHLEMRTIKQFSVLVILILITTLSWAQTAQQTNKSLYKAFEMSVSEGLNFQAAAKVGIKPVYGIFGIGNQFLGEDHQWAFGFGIGSHLIRQQKQSLNLEYMFYHVNQNELWTDSGNSLQQVKLHYSRRIAEKISIFGGPSFNVNIAENEMSYGHTFESTFPPYEMFTKVSDNHTVTGWIGFTLGLRFDK